MLLGPVYYDIVYLLAHKHLLLRRIARPRAEQMQALASIHAPMHAIARTCLQSQNVERIAKHVIDSINLNIRQEALVQTEHIRLLALAVSCTMDFIASSHPCSGHSLTISGTMNYFDHAPALKVLGCFALQPYDAQLPTSQAPIGSQYAHTRN